MVDSKKSKKKQSYNSAANSGGGAVYGLGLIGALIYFIQAADNFGMILIGILKALVWPAFVVYQLLQSFYG